MDKPFLVGVAEIEITPTLGLEMDGYMARVETNLGVHDPLMAQALVLEYDGRRAALVTLDIMAVSRSFTDPLRQDLAELLQTSPDAILICASHTHAGPRGLQDWSPLGSAPTLDRLMASGVYARIRAAVKQARGQMRPVGLRMAAGETSGIGGERNRPERPVDQRVTVLSFDGSDQEPAAILFHFACHPTVLSASNLEYSADYPGAARRRVRERYPNAVCLFVNGAAGNISTRFHRRDQSFAEVDRLGGLLGERVCELIAEAAPVEAALGWTRESLALPLRDFPAETRQLAASGNARIDTVRTQGATIEAQLRTAFAGRDSQPAEVCALRIGAAVLATVPGEAFNDLATGLRADWPNALIAGYANDYLGYFPTQAAIDDATYEALSSPYDARAHTLLARRLAALVERVQTTP